jgi:hypothetical protein
LAKKSKKKIARREYSKADVRELRAHSKARIPVDKIAKLSKRTVVSLRQKALESRHWPRPPALTKRQTISPNARPAAARSSIGRGADRPRDRIGVHVIKDRAQPSSSAASVANMHGLSGVPRLGTPFVSQADGKRAHPSQGKGRAQIVVELKRDLPFEIVWGSQGGAAECCADPK